MVSENKSTAKYWIIFVAVILAIIVIFNIFLLTDESACTTMNIVETSLEVKNGPHQVIGLNTDTNSLKMGRISTLSGVQRSILVNSTFDAEVEVIMDSPFSSWTTITPHNFKIKKDQSMEVQFDIFVPHNALEGNYTGKVSFCFKR